MGSGRHRTHPRDNDDKLRDKLRKIQSKIRSLEKEVGVLREANTQLQDALAKTFDQITDLLKWVPVEEVVEFNKDNRLNSKNVPSTQSRESVRKRFVGLIKNRSKPDNGGENDKES